MALLLSDEIVRATRLTEQELAQTLAVTLFEKDKLTLGQAARLAGMSQWAFRELLAAQEIPPHYDVAELEQDLATLQAMGRPCSSSATLLQSPASPRSTKLS